MPESPFLMLAGKDKPLKKGEAIAKSPFWESLGEEFAGSWSGQPAYWKYRKKYLKEIASTHGMWLVRQRGNYILVWKDRKGVDAYTSKNLWDITQKMREKAKLRWLL
jgi:hypothetical protein